jgi:hypothetical protein
MKRYQAGSALVEALIGTAIVALTVGTMFHAVSESAARNRMAEEKRFAALIAQSELAAVGPVIPIEPGVASGVEAGLTWRIQIEPYAGPSVPSKAGQLMQVSVSVHNHRGRQLLALNTLAIAPGS